MSQNGTRVAIYCRLSEEDRNKALITDDSLSIQNQKSLLLQYASDHGWEVFRIYSDDDYTGSDRNRPEFKQLLRDAEQRKFNVILCKAQSRFTRELELVETYIHGLFPVWGIRFVSIVDNADSDNKGNKKSRQINGLVNEWYLEDMSENIKSVLDNRRKNGLHIGSFALYGYQKDPSRRGHLVIDPEAAAVVREVFSLFAKGYGKTAIARQLNDRGIPNPSEYKRLHGLNYRSPPHKSSTLWKYSAISSMLTNEIYIGNMVQGKYGSISYKTKKNKPRPPEQWYRVEHTHEPIIDLQLWQQVQRKIQTRSKPFKSGTIGLFAGKVRCGSCGHVLRSVKSRGKHYLQCPTRQISKKTCPGAFISAEKLEHLVLAQLSQLTNACLDSEKLTSGFKLSNNIERVKDDLGHHIITIQKQIAEYDTGISCLYMDKVRGIVTEEEYLKLHTEFQARLTKLNELLRQHEQEQSLYSARKQNAVNLTEYLLQLTTPEKLTRPMLEHFVDHIVVYARISGTRTIPTEIHWLF